MKKLFLFGMIGAMALTFNACSSDDELANVNPTFNGEAVKTDFSISIGDVKDTRMSATSVQADETFKGMTDIYLFPAIGAITASTPFAQGFINLPGFTAFDPAGADGGELVTAQAKRYKDIEFALGVDHFLFYAAIADGNKDNGQIKPSFLALTADAANFVPAWIVDTDISTNSTPGDLYFDLVPYQKGEDVSKVQSEGANTVAIVNDIYAELKNQESAATTAGKNDIATRLNLMYTKMKNLDGSNVPEPFAGSALSVQEMIEDIYNSFYIDATTLSTLDATAQADYNTYYQPIIDLINVRFTVSGLTNGNYDLTWASTNDFPKTALGLPDGAVGLIYTAANEATKPFDYIVPSVDGMAVATLDLYTHPARLYYTINSPAMVKNAPYLFTNDVTGKTWGEICNEYTLGGVAANTQSVIMQDQVQYAVGRLDVQAQVKTGATILDSGSGVDGTADKDPQPVAVPAGGYTLTGVLIGGQKRVDWEFHPVTGTGVTEYTIYDGKMTTATAADYGTLTAVNHTLAFETAADAAVNIALEFTNTGNDFYGIGHKLIPAGSKFYLVARLDPTNAATIKSNPNNLNQVFKQDFVTKALLTIHETALQSAYNIIPDLRSPKLEFGLSVNLEWQEGITFEQTFQ